ncbi:MAG: malate dehydrogenase [Candidatus Omnitrophota bacterium]|jgi:malate dehydrogenase
MKISVIGAGNVGGLTAMRLAETGIGEILLVDIAKGLAHGKALDMEDSASVMRFNYSILGTDDMEQVKGSDITVITAGLARKPGMTREELLVKNAGILKDVCLKVRGLSPDSIVIIVTNPLDIMTYLALKVTGFPSSRVIGMGVSLDAGRFANLISRELRMPYTDIEACVIGSHGEGMLPLPRLTTVKGVELNELLTEEAVNTLTRRTRERGIEIVSALGSGSAYFAPSQAIAALVKAIAKDTKSTIGVSACLNGEYAEKDICIGVPCRLGRNGIEKIIELELNEEEKALFAQAAGSIRKNLELIKQFYHGL